MIVLFIPITVELQRNGQFQRYATLYTEDVLEHNFEYSISGNQVHTPNTVPLWEKMERTIIKKQELSWQSLFCNNQQCICISQIKTFFFLRLLVFMWSNAIARAYYLSTIQKCILFPVFLISMTCSLYLFLKTWFNVGEENEKPFLCCIFMSGALALAKSHSQTRWWVENDSQSDSPFSESHPCWHGKTSYTEEHV